MLTNEKVLEIFKTYLDKDRATEVVQTSHGPTVMLWDSTTKTWTEVDCCPTPEALFDKLMESFVFYKEFAIWEWYRREKPTEEERKQIQSMQQYFLQLRKEVESS